MLQFLFVLSALYLITACASQPTAAPQPVPQSAPQSNDITLSHIRAYLALGNFQKAEERFQIIDTPEQDPDALLVLAELRAVKGDNLGAQQAFLQSVNHSEVGRHQVSTDLLDYFCREKKWPILQGYALGLEGSDLPVTAKNQQLSSLGRCFFSGKYWQDAYNSLSKLDFNQQVEPFAYLALARLHVEQQQDKMAQQFIDKFEANKTQVDPEILWTSFEVYSALQKPQLAQQSAQQLVTLFPNNPFTRKYLILTKRNKNMRQEEVIAPPVLPVEHNIKPKIHLIKAGETLYQISKYYNISVADILLWNPGLAIDSISLGAPIQVAED